MPSSLTSQIEAAGKSNLTLIACAFLIIVPVVAALARKQRPRVRVQIALGLIALIVVLIVCIAPSRHEAQKQDYKGGNVVVQGDGNGTAAGNGNTVNVVKEPPRSKEEKH